MRALLFATTTGFALASTLPAQSAPSIKSSAIKLVPGVTLVQTLHTPVGDRESLVTIARVDRTGIAYLWSLVEVHHNGDTIKAATQITVKAEDLAKATRLRESIDRNVTEYPGYTSFSLSTAVYQQLVTQGTAPYAIRADEERNAAGLAGRVSTRPVLVLWRGTLTRASSKLEQFPLIVNGRRVMVPALRVRGQFTAARQRRWNPDIWVLADSTNPLLLKATRFANTWQTVRIDYGIADGIPGGEGELKGAGRPLRPGSADDLAAMLARECRVELPGIYFAFNSAALYETSDPALAALASVLNRHPDWIATIEGHTDSIGTLEANKLLSQRRAEAVRDRLISQHRIANKRLRAAGFGESRPRETNATIEGRARNRRVELVRQCSGT